MRCDIRNMKVNKQDVKAKNNNRNTSGKKVKQIGLGKIVRRVKDKLLSSNDEKLCISENDEQQEKMEICSIKEINTPVGSRHDYLNSSSETPVLWSSEGILRQSQTIIINDIKLTCSSPVPLCSENVHIPITSKELPQFTFPSKSVHSGTVLAGSIPLETLVPIPPISLTGETFSHGALSLMTLPSGPLPPVSEIPRPGNISSLSCSTESPRSTVSSELSGMDVVTSGNSSDMSNYDISQLGPHSMKVLVSLSNVSSSLHMGGTQTSASSKEGLVALVYSSASKMEPSILNSQKVLPLPPMSEMKSHHTSHLHSLTQRKIDATSGTSSNSNIDGDSEDSISEVVPVNTDVLSVSNCGSRNNVSIPNTPVSNGSSYGSSSNPIKLDDNHDNSSNLGHPETLANVDVSQSVHFETRSTSTDLNHIIIPVTSVGNSVKVTDHHALTTQELNHIITIPLPSSGINGNSVGISIPISGNSVPLSMPVQVTSGMLPLSCSLLPASSSSLQVSANIQSSPVSVSESSDSLLSSSGSIHQSYSCTTIPSVNPSVLETSIAGTSLQPHARLAADISGLITVTSSMIQPITTTNSMTSITSVPTSAISGISVSSSTDSIPVTSISVSIPSSSTTTSTTTMVFATQNPSLEPVTTYTMQSPAEILSQLSKAGVLPTMSSSQLQVMNLSSSVDKVSTLTQTEDLDLGHSVELGCNINLEPRSDNKVMSIPNEVHLPGGGRLLEQHLHLLHQAHERANIPTTMSLSNKNHSLTNLTPVNPHTSRDTSSVEQEVDLRNNTDLPSMYTRTTPKPNSCSNELLVTSLSRSDLTPKIDVQKQIVETMNRTASDPGTNEERIGAIFIKQEDFENSAKNNKSLCGNSTLTKRKKLPNNEDASKEKEVQCLNSKESGMDAYIEEVSCFKCKLCPYLTIDKKGVEIHVQMTHNSQIAGNQIETRQPIKCPGCKNEFFTSKSLKIHLSQDHFVDNAELKVLVESVLRNCRETTKLDRKRRKQVLKNNSNENSSSSDNTDSKDLPNSNCIVEVRNLPIPEVTIDECSKIRVRNLNTETLSEINQPLPVPANVAPVNETREEDNSNCASDDVRDGTLVIDDDPLMQQKQNCDFKMIKTDAETAYEQSIHSAVLLCEVLDDALAQKKQKREKKPSTSSSSPRKKRGRPKGSKNVLAENFENVSTNNAPVEKEFDYHRRCHHVDKYLCPECSQEVIHWNSLSTHLWRYHGIDMELFACDLCSYKTNSYSKLMNLHRRIHGDERPFLCDTCGKGFKNPKQMRNHKAIHTAKQKTAMGECDVCSRTFSSLRMLRVHKDNVHGKLRPHLCNYCGYSASSRSTLKMHMRQHTGEKPFHCDECDYETADHNSLRRHKMRHSGDKPYKCPHCTYACIQSSTYKVHLNTKHKGLETGLLFSCHMCSFRSVRKDNYLAHVAEHEIGANPSNRQRKHSSPKPQVDSNKGNQTQKVSTKLEKSRLPVIINISNVITPTDHGTLAEDMPLTPEFEAEQITGDIQDIKEPQELKFKVSEDITS
ncbi:hypothetical protein C0J52_21637 [Blattella germanica]|nr:hypothetical protein C0J52_21637 [Blattella germanica]